MKLIVFFSLIVFFFLNCRCTGDDTVKKFIPGTYIRYSEHEFGHEYDTIVISVVNRGSDEYRLVRKWKYDRVLDGEVIDPEYKQAVTSAFYNPSERRLDELQTGVFYTFDLKAKLLLNEHIKYNKL